MVEEKGGNYIYREAPVERKGRKWGNTSMFCSRSLTQKYIVVQQSDKTNISAMQVAGITNLFPELES